MRLSMDCTITRRNVNTFCRICLTSSKNLVSLTDPVAEKVSNLEDDTSVHAVLEMVTHNKIVLSDDLPSKICHMCLSFLKIAYEFQTQYKNSQEKLKDAIKVPIDETDECPVSSDAIQHEKQSPSVAVELIYGDKKFDLNDVLVIEEETKENFSYQGFLRNLGTEVSARFIGEKDVPRVRLADQDHHDISLEWQNDRTHINITQKFHLSNLDLSRLRVTKNTEECEIVIEEVTDTTATTIKTLYECPTCEKLFSAKNHLEMHQEAAHQTRQIFVCEKCGHQARTRSQLYHHLLMHREKTFQCSFCHKKYNTLSRLKAHLQGHKNERRHLCNHCGKSFNFATSLKYHLEAHAGRKLACNICGMKYTRPNTLQRHVRTHTKDRPYPCGYCPKRFPSQSEKASHEMIHTGTRPYRCKYCFKSFTKPYNLQVHGLSHAGPHECHLCAKTFVEMTFLKLHIKRSHRDYEIIEVLEN